MESYFYKAVGTIMTQRNVKGVVIVDKYGESLAYDGTLSCVAAGPVLEMTKACSRLHGEGLPTIRIEASDRTYTSVLIGQTENIKTAIEMIE
jgi:hypothetical protein